ncbi:MAG: CHAP domain-containing protein [Bifidobacterium sp.]
MHLVAAMRRNQIGKPVDAHMGNGAQWNDTAARLGYKVGRSPKPGDDVLRGRRARADGYYGHVAVVEQVNSDGSILISQSGTGWMAVVTQTISSAQLKANAGGVSFIH